LLQHRPPRAGIGHWQPIPFAAGDPDRPARPCGDLSLAPGGIASIAAVKTRCRKARRLAARWTPTTGRINAFTCTTTPHSFDQQLVECEHRGSRKGIAFIWRTEPVS
jgi:hypothetical protein